MNLGLGSACQEALNTSSLCLDLLNETIQDVTFEFSDDGAHNFFDNFGRSF